MGRRRRPWRCCCWRSSATWPAARSPPSPPPEPPLGGTQTLYVFALAVFSIGVGVGSLLCEKLSARTVEIGLVPLGAIGMSACIAHLALAPAIPAQGLGVAGFMAQPGSWRIVLDLAGIGLFSGFYVVPPFALI